MLKSCSDLLFFILLGCFVGMQQAEIALAQTPVITTVAGGYIGDGGQAKNAALRSPKGMAIGAGGVVYVADSDADRVRRIDRNGAISTIAGTGVRGFSGDGGPAKSARLNIPTAVALGPDGSIYVAEAGNYRVRRIDASGTISTFAGNGTQGFSGDGGPAIDARLHSPSGLAVGVDGSVYIADSGNHRIRRVDRIGRISTYAGGAREAGYAYDPVRPTFGGDGGPATAAGLYSPADVTAGLDGSIFIADAGNRRIRKVNSAGIISTFAGSGAAVDSNYTNNGDSNGDNGPAINARFNYPISVSARADGALYIGDSPYYLRLYSGIVGTVRIVDPNGSIRTFTSRRGGGPVTVSVEANDQSTNPVVYIGDSYDRQVYRIALKFDGMGLSYGSDSFAGGYLGDSGAATSAALRNPSGLAVRSNGIFYISDSHDHRVRRVESDGNINTVVGTGKVGYDSAGDGGPALSAMLSEPAGLAIKADGSLYIADAGNQRVRRVKPDGTIVNFAGALLGGGGNALLEGFAERCVSTTLRQPAWECSDFFPLSLPGSAG